jgi:hypothetical protein
VRRGLPGSLAGHLGDDNELVRCHLCTALVVIGCSHLEKLAEVVEPLQGRLGDENPYVQGRAAEALGLLAASGPGVESDPALDDVEAKHENPSTLLTDRLAFCRRQLAADQSADAPEGAGTIESIRDGTDDGVEETNAPDDGACPRCGLDLPESEPPMCPRCGVSRRYFWLA